MLKVTANLPPTGFLSHLGAREGWLCATAGAGCSAGSAPSPSTPSNESKMLELVAGFCIDKYIIITSAIVPLKSKETNPSLFLVHSVHKYPIYSKVDKRKLVLRYFIPFQYTRIQDIARRNCTLHSFTRMKVIHAPEWRFK